MREPGSLGFPDLPRTGPFLGAPTSPSRAEGPPCGPRLREFGSPPAYGPGPFVFNKGHLRILA